MKILDLVFSILIIVAVFILMIFICILAGHKSEVWEEIQKKYGRKK